MLSDFTFTAAQRVSLGQDMFDRMYRVIDFGRTKRDMWLSQNRDGSCRSKGAQDLTYSTHKAQKILQDEKDMKGFLGSTRSSTVWESLSLHIFAVIVLNVFCIEIAIWIVLGCAKVWHNPDHRVRSIPQRSYLPRQVWGRDTNVIQHAFVVFFMLDFFSNYLP